MFTAWRLIFIIVLCVVVALIVYHLSAHSKPLAHIDTLNDAERLLTFSREQITKKTDQAKRKALEKIAAIIVVPTADRTYQNTAKEFDELLGISDLAIVRNIVASLELVHPDQAIRDSAHAASIAIEEFYIDHITNNKALYEAFKEYVQGNAHHESLTEAQKYFLNLTMDDFKRLGLELPEEQLGKVKVVKKELTTLTLQFETNITKDQTTVTLNCQELVGLDDDFIASLKKTGDGRCILTLDYPTYHNVMENCQSVTVRKELYHAFVNRAYPANHDVLQQVITKRNELAQLLGFDSFAALDISDQMAQSVDHVQQFINQMINKAAAKAEVEFRELTRDLPDSVTLSPEGKLYAWDSSYVRNTYKKKHFNLDERVVSEYFPMENTIKGLLTIYEQFFNLTFKEKKVKLWHEDVTAIAVADKYHNILGYLLLDLYPRANKYSHACETTIIPATFSQEGNPNLAVAVVIANFPKSTPTKPALLKWDDVKTFFHEFGHALHDLLGRTSIVSLAGTNVKRDFVEMPSQMLENWLLDKDIVRNLSYHYKTSQSLPEELLNVIIKMRNFGSGNFVETQMLYAQLALDYFKPGSMKDVAGILKTLSERIKRFSHFDSQDHFYSAFGHLMGYGAKYYGYLWSQVFSTDLFQEIKKHGLLSPENGKKYVDLVLSKGGTQDPNQMLFNFLGRQPNQDAFLRDMGLL